MKERMKEKNAIKNSIGRAAFVALALLLQIAWIVSLINQAGVLYPYITLGTQLLALCLAVGVYNKNRSSASKISWIVLMLMFPVLGLCLYLLVGQPWATRSMRRRFEGIDHSMMQSLKADATVLAEAEAADPCIGGQLHYLQDWCKFPVYKNTQVQFQAQTDEAFALLTRELKQAQEFIFMEYHAIELSQSFMEIEAILAERARNGVEVRLFYDDVGSAVFINPHFVQRMEAQGIKCRVFNPITPVINAFMNNRDHRKITVIDGKTGFTGGYNLADEYFNLTHPYGHWKDTGIMLQGEAVNSLTAIFLEMWNAVKPEDADFSRYFRNVDPTLQGDGYVLPYADSPLDDERVGENAYLNLLKNARKYAWITTPYLILDEEMISELTLAARRGVDVRIITPGIPDKKVIFQLTRSYYTQLANCGVRIYEYTPGFLHAKQMLSDDTTAVVGTINLDYRSLYLHFENAVLLYCCGCIADIRRDFETTFPLCHEKTEQYQKKRIFPLRAGQALLRLFAPLL